MEWDQDLSSQFLLLQNTKIRDSVYYAHQWNFLFFF